MNLDVQNRQLTTWLTEEEYKSFESEWKNQQQIREELKEKPNELKRYEDKFRKAMFNENKAERFREKGNTDKARELCNLSESMCEDA